jgi:GT2 family glycosyltransferase/glycosyltransferase involved in cell wall biosynthesis
VVRRADDRAQRLALDGIRGGPFTNLPRRMLLTIRYRGFWSFVYRVITFPLRFTPLRPYLRLEASHMGGFESATAIRWYAEHGQPVSVVIPSYQDLSQIRNLVKSIRDTTRPEMVRIVISDDASGPEHVAALRRLPGVQVVEAASNGGFASNVNRGLAVTSSQTDVVLLNSDIVAAPGWLESLQYAASQADDVGIVGGKLLYADGRIQFAGTVRNRTSPVWFDHRFRFKRAEWGPANVPQEALAVTGACMYLKRALLDEIGGFDERYAMAYEDVDLCLRSWQAGYRVLYWPGARLYHLESVTRGRKVGPREQEAQREFWTKWGEFFDLRRVLNDEGKLRVIYVTQETGVGGGHRDIFEHLNGLLDRGHEVALWTLGGPPDWFDLRAPLRTFATYEDLTAALAPMEAIKVATWWNTASAVWRASVLNGIPVYFVQDIETSYYPEDEAMRHRVLASYRHEFRYMTISSWNRDQLRQLGLDAVLIPPGIDLENFRPLPEVERRDDMVLALGRSNPLKNLPLTLKAWRALPEPRPELCLFGIEPELAQGEPGIRYVTAPSDEEVNELFNQAAVFVQTSVHEGFCLPPLEAMATGGAVVCTDAHGNRDFCVDGKNCLMPEPSARSVSNAIARLLRDLEFRHQLGAAGIATAADYAWPRRLDALESFLNGLASPPQETISAVIRFAPETT